MKVIDLGRMEYGECLQFQRSLRDQRQRGEGEDAILVVEHPPVATLGRRGTPDQVFDETLPVHVIERGGEATYHAPGQLVVYPVVRLPEGDRDVRAWVRHLEAFLIGILAEFGIAAESRPDTPGVWTVETGKKIASIGIAIQHWVSFHGVALNVDVDLAGFQRIDPCGMGAAVMTSMAAEGADAAFEDVKRVAMRRATDHFEAITASTLIHNNA